MNKIYDSLRNFKYQWEDLPHHRKKLSKHFGKSGMDSPGAIRAALSKSNKNMK